MNTKLHFSTGNNELETPQDLYNRLNAQFGFTLDACASDENAKCEKYFTKETDALKQDWSGEVVWMDPPYSEPESACVKYCKKKRCVERGFHLSEYQPGCIDFMRKAYEEWKKGVTVVCLVASRTGTTWFHAFVYKKAEHEFLRGRLKFKPQNNSAPFDSVLVFYTH